MQQLPEEGGVCGMGGICSRLSTDAIGLEADIAVAGLVVLALSKCPMSDAAMAVGYVLYKGVSTKAGFESAEAIARRQTSGGLQDVSNEETIRAFVKSLKKREREMKNVEAFLEHTRWRMESILVIEEWKPI